MVERPQVVEDRRNGFRRRVAQQLDLGQGTQFMGLLGLQARPVYHYGRGCRD